MIPSPTPGFSDRLLPCQHAPDRWFDRAHRTVALEGCLGCPARAGCAARALRVRASWGMWAGIWIDGRHHDAAHYLRVIASESRSITAPAAPTPVTQPTPPRRDPTPAPLTALPRRLAKLSARDRVLARSSGHCEVMAPGCGYGPDRIITRAPRSDANDAALQFVACNGCAATLSRLDEPLARRLGYRLTSAAEARATPFHWRQSRWLVLDSHGGATPVTTNAQPA